MNALMHKKWREVAEGYYNTQTWKTVREKDQATEPAE